MLSSSLAQERERGKKKKEEMLDSSSIFSSHVSAFYVNFLSRQIIQAYGYKYYLYANDSQVYIHSPLKKI